MNNNTLNLKLSDFFDDESLYDLKEGVDYTVNFKTLFALNSTDWFNKLESITTTVTAICSVNLTNFPKLTSVRTTSPNLSSIILPPNPTFKSLFLNHATNRFISLTGNLDLLQITNCFNLTGIDISRVTGVDTLFIDNCYSLRSINFRPSVFDVINNRPLNISIDDCNLTNESCDSLWTSLCAKLSDSYYINVALNFRNALTGTNLLALSTIQQKIVFDRVTQIINLSAVPVTPGTNFNYLSGRMQSGYVGVYDITNVAWGIFQNNSVISILEARRIGPNSWPPGLRLDYLSGNCNLNFYLNNTPRLTGYLLDVRQPSFYRGPFAPAISGYPVPLGNATVIKTNPMDSVTIFFNTSGLRHQLLGFNTPSNTDVLNLILTITYPESGTNYEVPTFKPPLTAAPPAPGLPSLTSGFGYLYTLKT